jgi:glycosyltransferase involved in cell wall biosynthesis
VLRCVNVQKDDGLKTETIIVDSGSTDDTRTIAQDHGCKILEIQKEEFTFGRSLNRGCEAATGEFLVFVSGHCVPVNGDWLDNLVRPLKKGIADYVYGRQIGGSTSRFSECQLFNKYYPEKSLLPQASFFCNNANAGLSRSTWEAFRFNEELTGLEDMELGKRLVSAGLKIGYVAEAQVFHLHDESWMTVRRRYEREAIALQHIMPQVQINFGDFLRYFVSAVLSDSGVALQQRSFLSNVPEIFMFRLMQFWGSYRGNHEHRKLSREMKEMYFYPTAKKSAERPQSEHRTVTQNR